LGWYKNRYNKRSANKHGWHPSWFAAYLTDFDDELLDEVVKFQVEHDLKPDGMVGPVTFRRLLADRELQESALEEKYIIINGTYVPIDWDVTIDLIKPGAFRKNRHTRKPNMIVTHWDACTSAKKCKYVLEARNISTHFCIDNDGVIFQYVDTNDTAWHAGGVNKHSIGIDFSNAYYLKYNDIYEKRGFGRRPILKNSIVHGRKLKPHLGYYNIQIEAYKVLLKTLAKHYNIPLQTPKEARVYKEAKSGKYSGVVSHYHVSRKKIDCAGLDMHSILSELD
jgi:hypothetical protein